jgi:toxin CcdB
MSQFVLYRNTNKATQKNYPYLLEIQSNLLSELKTTVVIPVMPKRLAGEHVISRLNPVIKVKNEQLVVMTQSAAGVDRTVLGEKVADVSQHRAEIVAAVDFLLSGI